MHIYGDESGTFALAKDLNSWCVVATYSIAESQKRGMEEALSKLKRKTGVAFNAELKLKVATARGESDYFHFLEALNSVGGLLCATATDSGANVGGSDNQAAQIANIRLSAEALSPGDEQREAYKLANKLSALSPQLYVEFGCRLTLAWHTIRMAALHFVRRYPAALAHFRWRIDEKAPNLEFLYRSLMPGVISALAKTDPLELLDEGNYRLFSEFMVPHDVRAGPAMPPEARIYDAASLLGRNLSFVDSKQCIGIQVVDLLVSGMRRCLRGEMRDNDTAARLLGGLMMRPPHDAEVVRLLYFTAGGSPIVGETAMRAVQAMGQAARDYREIPAR